MRKFINILFFILALFLPTLLLAEKQDRTNPIFPEGAPIAISSEKMTVKGLEDKVFFEGAVFIQKGDVSMKAGRAEVLLANKEHDPSKKTSSSSLSALSSAEGKEIVQIELTEKVEVQHGNRRVSAHKGIYDAKEGEIILTGDAQMWEEGYHVKGRVIRLSLTKKRSFIEGSQLTIY
jgi:lipopolysaccharide transport protein LptA